MKRSILAGISMLVVAIASPLSVNATSQTTPSNLANLARNGYFQEQGISSYSALDTAIARGQVNGENLIEADKVAPETLNDEGYVNSVEMKLDLMTND
ncbi:MAG: hypothetical protein RLZZ499_3271 [Cyanobacteriota bacterium]|jgi:hypothetical protein